MKNIPLWAVPLYLVLLGIMAVLTVLLVVVYCCMGPS